MSWRSRIIGHDKVDPEQLTGNPRNHRTHPQKQRDVVRDSIEEFGFVKSVLVNKTTGFIVDGHERVWQALNAKQNDPTVMIDVEYVELSEAEEAAVLAVLDASTEMAVVDPVKLDELLREVNTESQAIADMLTELAEESGALDLGETAEIEDIEPQIDRASELAEEWGTAEGQLWIIKGKQEHRLLCGDSTKKDDVERLMDGQRADICCTSPPYNANAKAPDGDVFGGKSSKRMYTDTADNRSSDEYIEFAKSALDLCFEATDGFVFWNVSYNANSRHEYITQISDKLPFLIEQVCWKKSSAIPITGSMRRAWEPVYVFSTSGSGLGLKQVESNYWEVSNANSQTESHKACFPLELPSRAIRLLPLSTKVYEPFCGSGTTMLAAEQLNRRCYGMEISPKYVAVILQRMKEAGCECSLEG